MFNILFYSDKESVIHIEGATQSIGEHAINI